MSLRALALVTTMLPALPALGQPSPDALAERARAAGLTQEIAAKLSSDQLESILRHDAANEVPAIATVSVVGFFLTVMVVVGLALYRGHLKERQQHTTLRAIIERGGQIPPELLTAARRADADLKWGILLLSFGVGLMALIGLVAGNGWAVGLLPISVGAGYLVVWALGRRDRTAGEP